MSKSVVSFSAAGALTASSTFSPPAVVLPPFTLRSAWALLPAAATVAWVALRTVLEDRMLHRGLPGYAGYAGRVRARWIPGVW